MRLLLRQQNHPKMQQTFWNEIANCDGHVDQYRKAGGKRWENVVSLTQCAIEYTKTTETFDTVLKIFCSVSTPLMLVMKKTDQSSS